MTGRRQVSIDQTDATSIAVALSHLELWLRRAPAEVTASLAVSVYGEPTQRALGWARELISDMRYYHTVLACAIRADDTGSTSNTDRITF